LVALSKMRNILLGVVVDDHCAKDLLDLLDDALNHLTVVKRLIAIAPDVLGPSSPGGGTYLAETAFDSPSPEMRLMHSLWIQKSAILVASNRTNNALLEATEAVRRTRQALLERTDVVSITPGAFLDSIQRLDNAFRELAAALADLGRIQPHF